VAADRNALAIPSGRTRNVGEVFVVFLKLGLTSFGGPIAHLAYFRQELVANRKWLDDNHYSQLLALCQFLPGPASSQLGFSLGLLRAGWLGALAAFLAFTLPSAFLLFAFATFLPHMSGAAGQTAIHGLNLVALAVVAQGVLGMTRQLCPDPQRATIATLCAAIILVSGAAATQLLVIGIGAAAGFALRRNVQPPSVVRFKLRYGATPGLILLAIFAALLLGLPLLAHEQDRLAAVADAFYRAGALVFGGGHVVLPLLKELTVEPGWISADEFLAGYGAAQAVPGPMFALAAYLGARLPGELGGQLGASVALIAIFLPGFLLIAGILPLWRAIAAHQRAAQAIAGVNAAVVGLLAAALYDPLWINAVRGPADVAVALVGFTMLVAWRIPALLVVGWCVAGALVASLL
jgi:chromate transporter